MKPRLAVIGVVIAGAAVPSAASAATLSVDRPCYGPNESAKVVGTGFTPNRPVAVAVRNQLLTPSVANGVGVFTKSLVTPTISQRERRDSLIAVDATNTAIRASTTALLTRLRVTLSPRRFRPGRGIRIRARGFTQGTRLYAHVRRGKRHRRNIRIGPLKTCGVLSKKRTLLRRGTRGGTYLVQFDNKRRYSRTTRPAARFKIRVRRRLVRTASNAASSSSIQTLWTQAK